MGKIYNNDLGSARLVRKTGLYNDNYKGPDGETIARNMVTPHACRICGQPMTPYKDMGNILIWKCDMQFCINNPDSKLKFDIDAELMNNMGNIYRKWDDFVPRKIF